MIKNTDHLYGSLARLLHWGIGFLLIGQLAIGYWMPGLPDGDSKWAIYGLHKSIGVILLGLGLARVLWRLVNPTPIFLANFTRWYRYLAQTTHFALYAFTILMSLSGFLMSWAGGYPINFFSLFTISAAEPKIAEISQWAYLVHGYAAWPFSILIVGHIIAAFYHHFALKDETLRRMIGLKSRSL